MAKKFSSIAKITRPTLPDVFPRERLFRLLDEGRKGRVVWISGPAGSGKTTLVTSWLDSRKLSCIWYQVDAGDADLATFFYYLGLAARKAAPGTRRPLPLLTPEYLLDIPTFSRRYFENLCARVKPPFLIVLDNYQHVSSGSPFHEIIAAGFTAVPEGILAVVISRAEPPRSFAGMQAGNRLAQIGWDQLRLTKEESTGIARLHLDTGANLEAISLIHDKTQGWAAGIILLSKFMKQEVVDPQALNTLAPEKVFDFFANELFDKADAGMQEFLLTTAFLPKITPAVAERLTGNREAGSMLSELNRRNYFTEKRLDHEIVYQYHPLFREFLLIRAKESLPQDAITRLQLKAAELLETAGHIEAAVDLFRQAEGWQCLARLILRNAQNMVLQGRSLLAREWLGALPGEVLKGDPWLLYWMGVCRTPFAPADARLPFEKAFALFKRRRDRAGVLLAWAGVVRTYFLEFNDFYPLDPWIAWLEKYLERYPAFPSVEIETEVTDAMLVGLTYRRPSAGKLQYWARKAVAVSRKNNVPDLQIRLLGAVLQCYAWMGEFGAAQAVFEEIQKLAQGPHVSPLSKLSAVTYGSLLRTVTPVSQEECMQDIQRAIDMARQSGIAVWVSQLFHLGFMAAMNRMDDASAREFLEGLAAGSVNVRQVASLILFDRAWYHIGEGKAEEAAAQAEQILEMMAQSGTPYPEMLSRIVLVEALHLAGRQVRARAELGRVKKSAELVGSKWLINRIALIEAEMAFDRGDERAGMRCLGQAMELGRQQGYFTMAFHWRPRAMARLCARALDAGLETKYVRELIRTLDLAPDGSYSLGEAWPWPVRIHTLGRFALLRDGKPVGFSGKVQKKPLELLKALISFGGRDVREEQLIDALWPEAYGDAARISFKTTLHRLRQLLGNDKVIQVQDGRVSLDQRYCWVDAWAFENAVQSAEFGVPSEKPEKREAGGARRKSAIRNPQSEIPQRLEKALQLYQGHFLSGDDGKPWVASPQERLKAKFVKAVMALGEHLQIQKSAIGNPKSAIEKAIAFYEKGLEVDDLAEELYQRLMLCHQKLGRKADAVKTYRRCRDMLQTNLGVEPSQETEKIYQSLTAR